MAKNLWLVLVKKYVNEIKKEDKLKGLAIMKEAIKRAKKVYVKTKKGGPEAYKKGLAGRKIQSKDKGRGLGYGKGKGPKGIPVGRK